MVYTQESKQSWDRLDSRESFFEAFYAKLFEKLPKTKELFQNVEIQHQKVSNLLNMMFNGLDLIDVLENELNQVKKNHEKYNLKLQDFIIWRDLFIETLDEHIYLTPKEKLSWRFSFNTLIVEIMPD